MKYRIKAGTLEKIVSKDEYLEILQDELTNHSDREHRCYYLCGNEIITLEIVL